MEAKNKRHLAVTKSGKVVGVASVRDFLHPLYLKEDAEKVIKQASGFQLNKSQIEILSCNYSAWVDKTPD